MSSQQNPKNGGNNARPEAAVQHLEKEVVVARELAILGDYDGSLQKFQRIHEVVHNYSKRYEHSGPGAVSGREKGGYAAQTASSQKKRNAAQGADGLAVGNAGDIYLQEKWNAFKKNLKKEFDMVAQMHQLLQQLDDDPPVIGSLGELDDIYQIDALVQEKKKQSRFTNANERKPVVPANNQKKPRKSSRSDLKPVGAGARVMSAAPAHPPKSQNVRAQQPLKFKSPSMVDQDSAAAGLPPATNTPRNNENFVLQKKPSTNIKQRPDVFNYDNLENNRQSNKQSGQHSPVTNRLADHFGLQPFQHHKLEKMGIDVKVQRNNFLNERDPPEDQNNDRYVNHQIFIKQPAKRDDSLQQDKDPDVWDPPTPQKREKKQKSNPNWGAQGRKNRKPGVPSQPRGGPGVNPRSNPLGAYGAVDRAAAPSNRGGNDPSGKRNYDKPWLPPPQEKKNKEAKTYAEYLFGEGGIGPDSDLINQIEQNMLQKNPCVSFDDIAELDETKKLLQEAVLLPILMPDYFRGIRRPWKGVCMFGPPGTGKTMLAKAVATQGQTTFFNISAAGMNSKWKGESEKLVRILFEMARFYAPSTIFFDEIDALATQRGKSSENEASRRVKAELLIQMDGVAGSSSASANDAEDEEQAKKTVMVLAATNRPQDLDEAIRRRLEKRVYIPLPTAKGREAIFQINLKNVAVDSNVDFKKLVGLTDGYSGADLANVCRDAAMEPMRRKLNSTGFDFENINDHAKDIEAPLVMEDFMTAINKNQRTVSRELLKEYEDWMAEFGAN